ncbi:aliphatic sulfonate ABC transporter periplasmic ligand-binding protein [Agrobacterium sp. ATCC 31749]|uniref:ABC transporter substrate-binding protein n=1 Tax=unclassified Agrobacterium TaxID=2632611 RepID=UPI00020DBE63|nr:MULTISPECIES: ABC transporter substrate-binding protein [unclassified Agrobacterium]EGL62115.1 aliphatic sulfonate ABC transporter periplasmic ligand-binding protein [Agrobacterium sp. ATCC 31749]QKX00482.1 ABC transporter substrate-binding protein [Agrobacterium sp. CGMCC 11546]
MFKQIIVAAFAMALLASAASAQKLTEIKVGAGPSTGSSPVFVGIAQGIFAKHGLDVKLDIQQIGTEIINGVVSQNNDIGLLGSTPFITGVSKGMPLVLIGHLHGDASQDSYSSAQSVIASKQSAVADVKSFSGKRIGLPRGTSAETYVAGLMAEQGLKIEDAILINLKPGDVASALRNGDVDIVAVWEPVATTAAIKIPGAKRIQQGNCQACYDPGVIITHRATIKAKKDVLQKFMLAMDESMAWLRTYPKESAEIVMKWVPGVDADVMLEAIKYEGRDARISKNTIDGYNSKTIPSLVSGQKIDAAFDVTPAVDPSFSVNDQKEHPELFSDLPVIKDDKMF